MFESIVFKNFKALRQATLPLSRFTLIVGPNGSGKSTALQGVLALGWNRSIDRHEQVRSADVPAAQATIVGAMWGEAGNQYTVSVQWTTPQGRGSPRYQPEANNRHPRGDRPSEAIRRARLFALDANAIAQPVQLQPQMELAQNGANLAGVLDRMRDQNPERFDALNERLSGWIPEFDQVLFETPGAGTRSITLRTRQGHHQIRAIDLSQGTLIALALLTIAYLPEPPSILCLEEPDHGLHPRLLRDVKDALYRLSYPEGAQEKREPVQVIATTHNPYFLDLFRDHPEEIVIAEKQGLEATFSRLSDRPDLEEILGDASLSEVWYSGVLGGVPTGA